MPTVPELVATGPEGILAWLESHKDDPNLARTFHWQGLAEAAARRARIRHNPHLAAVAIQVYEHWAALTGGTAYESARLSIMFLRAFFIRDLGPAAGDPLRDVQTLVAEFEDGLAHSLREALELSVGWERLDVSEIRELRRIKDRLAPFELLDPPLLDPFPLVQEWLAIRDELP